jgi:gamma-glutamylcyclotransferase (GGCT)/AIG2-like uncharacterized protein YtfP
MRMHVFTYGTLMFDEVWQAVVGRSFPMVRGTARGFAIFRVQGAVFPGIVAAAEEEAVRGVVYLDVDDDSLARLDLFEDDFYRREALRIACDDGQQRLAHAYVVPAESRAVLTTESWDADEFVASGGLKHFICRFQGFARVSEQTQ